VVTSAHHNGRSAARQPGREGVGVFRIAGGKIAECWLVPFDQYLFDELWS
jgi:hypothetical protein